jgi:hypothetical protein
LVTLTLVDHTLAEDDADEEEDEGEGTRKRSQEEKERKRKVRGVALSSPSTAVCRLVFKRHGLERMVAHLVHV